MRANLRDGSYSLKVGTIPPKSDSYVPTPAAASASIVLDAKSAKLQRKYFRCKMLVALESATNLQFHSDQRLGPGNK